ncbi:MAG: type III pantothenate kinase [Pseudoflavonifractor sp.]|nr:type III pantothenate kinase [Alloprevotella sp.]MCM1116062.1 type III pantothenate kinase [Pseudoflavonifractor sp.]
MSLLLTIDQGNTAAKMALWDGHELQSELVEPHLTPEIVRRYLDAAPALVSAALYCSVAEKGQQLLDDLRSRGIRVGRLTSSTPLPITIGYKTPHTLGADRIAAAAGAWALHPGKPLLVVDAGTAVTYDYVDPSGRFVGGNIAPGMRMRLEALHRFTARLPRLEVPREIKPNHFFGTDTREAMILGALYGIVAAIAYYRSRLPADTVTVITGGWASVISGICDFDVDHIPNLVSLGLNTILLYNENKPQHHIINNA